ncbi:Hypothetical protein A7982_09470 [Minicystis rosea]|nr:Hypothetical protein A7982_09470 [Minicystis rosea]
MLRATSCVLFLGLGLAACVIPPSSAQRLTESAYDLNTAARFGRMDVALEHVRDTARGDFNVRHAGWGRTARIVDYEFGGVSMRKDGDADVVVTVLWQRADETTMRTTDIAQRWTEKRGTWWMIAEEERSGDRGLLADLSPKEDAAKSDAPAAPNAAPPASPRSRYQTRTIYEQ